MDEDFSMLVENRWLLYKDGVFLNLSARESKRGRKKTQKNRENNKEIRGLGDSQSDKRKSLSALLFEKKNDLRIQSLNYEKRLASERLKFEEAIKFKF